MKMLSINQRNYRNIFQIQIFKIVFKIKIRIKNGRNN